MKEIQEKTLARVGRECHPDQPLTASVNETTPTTLTPDQISNVLRELDSYRGAIREAFDEGYAASGMRSPIEYAWSRSEARQAEWGFAHTRMSVGAIVRNQQPSGLRGDPVAPRTVNVPTRDEPLKPS